MHDLLKYVWGLLICSSMACQSKKNIEPHLPLQINEIQVETNQSGEGNLSRSSDGNTYLSFIEYENDSLDVLKFCVWNDGSWSSPKPIAAGSDWFVNWADFPSLVQFENDPSVLIAHWLQKSAPGTFEYDIRISLSKDAGNSWSPSTILHNDRIKAEHGFASMVPVGDNIRAIWLDGRNTNTDKKHDDHGHGGEGSMALYTALIDKNGRVSEETLLDERVCDCCQTDAVKTDKAVVSVYRDRTKEEIRDIGMVHVGNKGRITTNIIANDGWEISGCPVNGPAIDAKDSITAVAWYTETDSIPKVKLVISGDYGNEIGLPVTLAEKTPLGRVDIKFLASQNLLITYLDRLNDETWIMGVLFDVKSKSIISKNKLIETDQSRISGFPRMVVLEDNVLLVCTQKKGNITQIKTYLINI